jgi:hypothetical protein
LTACRSGRVQASCSSSLTHSEKEIAAGLGVGGTLASASGEGREGESFILEFADVQVAKVSLVQLRETLRKNVPECQEVRPFIDAAYTPAIPAPTKPGKKRPARLRHE